MYLWCASWYDLILACYTGMWNYHCILLGCRMCVFALFCAQLFPFAAQLGHNLAGFAINLGNFGLVYPLWRTLLLGPLGCVC